MEKIKGRDQCKGRHVNGSQLFKKMEVVTPLPPAPIFLDSGQRTTFQLGSSSSFFHGVIITDFVEVAKLLSGQFKKTLKRMAILQSLSMMASTIIYPRNCPQCRQRDTEWPRTNVSSFFRTFPGIQNNILNALYFE